MKTFIKVEIDDNTFIELPIECVNAGLTVYWHKELTEEEKKHSHNIMYHRRWFYVTNGKNVLYVGINSYGNLRLQFSIYP